MSLIGTTALILGGFVAFALLSDEKQEEKKDSKVGRLNPEEVLRSLEDGEYFYTILRNGTIRRNDIRNKDSIYYFILSRTNNGYWPKDTKFFVSEGTIYIGSVSFNNFEKYNKECRVFLSICKYDFEIALKKSGK